MQKNVFSERFVCNAANNNDNKSVCYPQLNGVPHWIRIALFSHNSMNTEMCERKNSEREGWHEQEKKTALADYDTLTVP